MQTTSGYLPLLKKTRFEAFLWTQFLGAFNDNVYKMIVSLMAVRVASSGQLSSRYLALAGAVFVLPFLLFAGWAGQVSDRFSKTRVLQVTKLFEIAIMLTGIAALLTARIDLLLVVLFLLAIHSNFFSPAKYGILPETESEAQLTRANGLLELSTFAAIIVGTSFGTFLFERWKETPLRMGLTLLSIAVAGALCSIHIQPVCATRPNEPIHWNPFREIVAGARTLLARKPLALDIAGLSWFWFIGALFQLALILEGKEVLHVSETHVGFLVTALATGIGLGSIVAGAISGDYIELGLVPAGSALMGVCSVALGLTTNFTVALILLAGVGFGGGFFAVPLNAYLQDKAPIDEKGRLMATNNFANMLGVILASGALWLLHDLFHWKAASIILALGFLILAGTIYIAALLPDRALRFVLWCAANLLFRLRVQGAHHIPTVGPAVLVANHVSFADSVLVGYTTPRMAHFLMWQPFYEMAAAKAIFRILHAIPISQNSPKQVVLAIRAAREQLTAGKLVAIFPEGGITRDGEVQPFERGVERIAAGLDIPVIPIHIDGLYGHPLSYKNGGLLRSWRGVFRPRVTIRVGPPLFDHPSAAQLRQRIIDLRSQDAALAGAQGGVQ